MADFTNPMARERDRQARRVPNQHVADRQEQPDEPARRDGAGDRCGARSALARECRTASPIGQSAWAGRD